MSSIIGVSLIVLGVGLVLRLQQVRKARDLDPNFASEYGRVLGTYQLLIGAGIMAVVAGVATLTGYI